jgi:chemotaxis response regulator CheB
MRNALAAFAVILATLLVPLGIGATWLALRVDDTSAYVDTVAPLADNADVQQTVATLVVNALFDQVDAPKRIEDALPKRAEFLGEPIATAESGTRMKPRTRRTTETTFCQRFARRGVSATAVPGVVMGASAEGPVSLMVQAPSRRPAPLAATR